MRTFTYRASDGGAFSNTVTVTHHHERAAGGREQCVRRWSEDTPLTVNAPGVLANDSDPESAPLTAVNATTPAHGALTLNANGSFSYTPATNYAGGDSFTYQAFDGGRFSTPATVTLTVTPVNDAPVAQADNYTAIPNQVLTVSAAQGILGNDSDPENSPLTLTQLSNPVSGVLVLAANGSFTYTPNTGFNGSDSFTYRISDGTLNSGTATVTHQGRAAGR